MATSSASSSSSPSSSTAFTLGKHATIFEAIRESCELFSQLDPCVTIDEDRLREFAGSLDHGRILEACVLPVYPFRFSLESKINFIATLHLLNFASGYRLALHEEREEGAWNTIRGGVIRLFMDPLDLDADRYSQITLQQVSEAFGVPLTHEVCIMPAVYQTKPHPLKKLAQQIVDVLHSTGRVLRSRQCKDFAAFILDPSLRKAEPSAEEEPSTPEAVEAGADDAEDLEPRDRRPIDMVKLVYELAHAFPALDDRYVGPLAGATADEAEEADEAAAEAAQAPSVEVCLFKKAQIMVHELYVSFKRDKNRGARAVFNFAKAEVAQMTVFSDNVIPAVLRHAGVLRVGGKLLKRIEAGKEVRRGASETALRAAAVVASARIAALWNEAHADSQRLQIDEASLDHYLWLIGKDPEYRPVPRHATRDTIFY